jgi:uncharacterized protein (DUF924 family)
MDIEPKDIINFWYSDKIKKAWFSSTPELDHEILENYENIWEKASQKKLDDWSNTPEGCLALIIIMDQLPLNMFRNQPKSFKTEANALKVARKAVKHHFDLKIDNEKRAFLYMPFMHSETLEDQEFSVQLYKKNNLQGNVRFAEHHRDIIKKFGRFPHRNNILGRQSTKKEVEYLQSDKAFKG